MSIRPIRTALLSTADKTGLVDLARALDGRGISLVSTGGTARALRDAGLAVTDVTSLTGFPEILDGRVKTLHPAVHAGLLARADDPAHVAVLREHGMTPIDLLVVDLYPFEAALARGAAFDAQIEEIDVGGPAMIRAAAKNHGTVTVLVDPADYPLLVEMIEANGGTDLPLRQRLAAKAFARTAAYDATIAGWLAAATDEIFPERLTIAGTRRQILRYGENPHQRGAWYTTDPAAPGLATVRQLQGKELSFNNLLDTDAALAIVRDLPQPAVAIVKHGNPCGVAIGVDLPTAWKKALACDPVSAFGGIVAVNRPLDPAAAASMAELFLEVVLAPETTEGARAALAARTGLRLLESGGPLAPPAGGRKLRTIDGGFLVQDLDTGTLDTGTLAAATVRQPGPAERADLAFAWTVVKHVASNAIVLARDGATVGIGMGQTNRVDAVWLAARRMVAGPGAGPCVCASDAFFPFADGLIAAAEAGATAVIQPGGSIRDKEVIAAADERGVAMVLTGMRHFRH